MAKHLIIRTDRGAYRVNENGELTRYNTREFSGGWIFYGLSHKKRSLTIKFEDINEKTLNEIRRDLLYKNGNPQWTVRDVDHGTTRIWGGGGVYGVYSMYFEDVQEQGSNLDS